MANLASGAIAYLVRCRSVRLFPLPRPCLTMNLSRRDALGPEYRAPGDSEYHADSPWFVQTTSRREKNLKG